MADGKNQRKISSVLVNPRYQLKFVVMLCASSFILFVALISVFYRFVSENYRILVELSPMNDEVRGLLQSELNQLVLILFFASLLYFILLAVLGLFLSHSSAGPIFHLKQAMAEVNNGNSNIRIKFRPNDDFSDVAETFNTMMDKIYGPKSN